MTRTREQPRTEALRDLQRQLRLIHSLPARLSGEEYSCNARDTGDVDSISGSGRCWRRKWQPTPVFLPGESHGERSLAGLQGDWSHKGGPPMGGGLPGVAKSWTQLK